MHKNLKTIDDVAEAKYQFELWLLNNPVCRLYCQSCRLAELARDNLAVTVEFGKLIFAYWNEDLSESWRISSYSVTPQRLSFTANAPFQPMPFSFELRAESEITSERSEHWRSDYLQTLSTLIERVLPEHKIERANIGRNDRYGFGAAVARLQIASRQKLIAAVGMSRFEDNAAIATLLGQGINWLYRLRQRAAKSSTKKEQISIDRLWLFAPAARADQLAERLTLISRAHFEIELFEVDESAGEIRAVRAFDQGDLGLRLAQSSHLPQRASYQELVKDLSPVIIEQLDWMRTLAPELIELRSVSPTSIKLEIYGLELARIYCGMACSRAGARIEFGIDNRKLLTGDNRAELAELISQVITARAPDSDSRQHQFYRVNSEAWLEALLRRDIRQLDAELLPEYLYSQVPAIRQQHERFIDLLAIRRDGQLVVIELKVNEQAELPFQGLDYWLRVEWHRRRGDLIRQGYFPARLLKDAPAWVYLVAPRLRFHQSFKLFTSLIDSQLPIYCIAINDNWRDGLKVDQRKRMN